MHITENSLKELIRNILNEEIEKSSKEESDLEEELNLSSGFFNRYRNALKRGDESKLELMWKNAMSKLDKKQQMLLFKKLNMMETMK